MGVEKLILCYVYYGAFDAFEGQLHVGGPREFVRRIKAGAEGSSELSKIVYKFIPLVRSAHEAAKLFAGCRRREVLDGVEFVA